MVFNATFNTISVISWRPVLFGGGNRNTTATLQIYTDYINDGYMTGIIDGTGKTYFLQHILSNSFI